VSVRGVVFDLAGTLVDNMPLHTEAFVDFVARHGLGPYDEAQRVRLDGKRNAEIFPVLFGRDLPAEDLKAYAHEKEDLYRRLSRGRLAPLNGLDRLLDLLRARGLPVAIATSGPAENVAHTLAETGLARHFSVVVRGDQVARGKPFPDIFLAAAERLGVAPAECLAFEDSVAGLEAARAAGMACVAIATSVSAEALAAAGIAPDHVVPDYEAFLSGPGRRLLEVEGVA
jgi:beta-phosphoglucomutase family hydrolase